MDESAFSMEVGPKAAKVGLFRRLLSSVAGAGSTEYVLIIGACSLGGLIGFKNFGKALRSDLGKEAQLILGKETPSVAPPELIKTPGGLKPFLDGFVPPGGFFPACGVKGCTQCSLPKPSDVASHSSAITRSGTTSNSNGAVDPRSSGCSGTPPQEPPVEDARTCEEKKQGKSCDPTKWLPLGRSPSLSSCDVETSDSGPPYEFTVKPKKGKTTDQCKTSKLRIGSDCRATFCLSNRIEIGARGDEGKADAGQEHKNQYESSYCGEDSLEVTYTPLDRAQPTSSVDLSHYALQDSSGNAYVVVVPVSVGGGGSSSGSEKLPRSNKDDEIDFDNSYKALALQRNENWEDVKREFKNNYTWHHSNLLKDANGNYYYEMILVPTAIHGIVPHEGGSSWARDSSGAPTGNTSAATFDPNVSLPPTSPAHDASCDPNLLENLPEECKQCPAEGSAG